MPTLILELAVITMLLAAAAWAGDQALRPYRKPVRWVWLAALLGGLLIPVASKLGLGLRLAAFTSSRGTLPEVRIPVFVTDLGTFANPPAVESGRSILDALVINLWVGASALVLGYVALSWRRLARRRRHWPARSLEGGTVLVSRSTGPAVMGLLRSSIVLPRWTFDLPPEKQRVILLHEREHQRAGDTRLLTVGLLCAAAMPWNPVCWWLLRRLRLATEQDCDLRVVRRGIPARSYGSVLLEVGERGSTVPLPLAAVFAPKSLLERRIRALVGARPRFRAGRIAVASSATLLLLGIACSVPTPSELNNADATPDEGVSPDETPGASGAAGPKPIPYDEPPRLQNPEEMVVLVNEESAAWPQLGGNTILLLNIDASGSVADATVQKSSGFAEVDAAALRVARQMRFSPARNKGVPTAVWVAQPIQFSKTPDSLQAGHAPPQPMPATRPTFIYYDEPPKLLNPDEILRQLKEERAAWPQLKGFTVLWLNIDASGSVAEVIVKESSGFEQLDAAAERVAAKMRWSPALNRDVKTAVWVAQLIQFKERKPPNPRDNSGSSEDIELPNVGEGREPHEALRALSPPEAPVDLQELFRQTGIDPEQIESVEVVRGPALYLLWNEPTDGVIILETKRIDAAEKARWERILEDEREESYRRFAKLSGLSPGELKSVHVIKGPTAEAIWGGRPNTGVIILRARGD